MFQLLAQAEAAEGVRVPRTVEWYQKWSEFPFEGHNRAGNVGHCYDPETKQQSHLWKSPSASRPPRARQVQSNIKCLLKMFWLWGYCSSGIYSSGPDDSPALLPGGFAGNLPKTSGTMAEPELIHSKWQWAGANSFVTAAKHMAVTPSTSLLTWLGPLLFLLFSENETAPTRTAFPHCPWNPGVIARPSYARLKIVSSRGVSSNCGWGTKLGAWKGTTLKRLWLGPGTFGYAIVWA